MSAGDKNDPFSGSRKWLKEWTHDLSDPTYVRLSSVARAVLADLERFSLRSSDVPGHFLYNGEPMPLDDLMRGIAPRDVDQDQLNRAGVQELLQNGHWLRYGEDAGYTLPKWTERQDRTIVEAESARRKREGAAKRQREKRERDAGGARHPKVRPFRKGGKR